MLDRKRQAKHYHVVPGDEDGFDLELGDGVGSQESIGASPVAPRAEAEADTWDEQEDDNWDDEGPTGTESLDGEGPKTPSSGGAGDETAEGKKQNE